MKVLPYAIGGLFGGTLLKSLFGKPKSPPPPEPAVTTDTARDAALRNDELLRRRGGAADMVTGAYGAPVAPGATGKTSLGS